MVTKFARYLVIQDMPNPIVTLFPAWLLFIVLTYHRVVHQSTTTFRRRTYSESERIVNFTNKQNPFHSSFRH